MNRYSNFVWGVLRILAACNSVSQDVSANMSADEWSVVAPRDRQPKQRQARGPEKREASNGAGDESLIGSFVYRPDRSPLTPLDSHLIGAPFVLSEPDQGSA